MTAALAQPFDVRRALRAPQALQPFNDAGVLSAADVHVAARLARIGGDEDPDVALAAALAVRGPRLGHVFVDLATIASTATVDADEPVDLSDLPWPSADVWVERVRASPLVAVGDDSSEHDRPLRLVGSQLYLDRYWREECQVAADLRALAGAPPSDVDHDVLADGLSRLFGGTGDELQQIAAAAAVLQRFAVVAGGPGTGKTTTVSRIVALLAEQAAVAGKPPPLVALAAPTGKAAARLTESVQHETGQLAVEDSIRGQLEQLESSTLHRLLGWRPDSHSRFRHGRGNRLPHDVVVVDETSMVSLSMMARLVEAIRPDARLILVGDPGQLTSIEAGAVLGDIVGPAVGGLQMRQTRPPSESVIADGVVVLERVHRFGGAIATLATAVRRGDADAAIEVLGRGAEDVTWIPIDVAEPTLELEPLRRGVVDAGRTVIEAARAGDAGAAIAALGAFRVLCAHRRGEYGVSTWMARIEAWLGEEIAGFDAGGEWYVGRPLLVTENDYGVRLYNGDTGVIVADGLDRVSAAFERGAEVLRLSPTRLGAVDTVYAMTIHKSQGSQFDTAAVLLPGPDSQILTRELLYTAVTRARERLVVVGTEEAIRVAVERPVARASGLRWRLWGEG